MRSEKLNYLIENGWSREDILELFSEVLDLAFEHEHNLKEKSVNEVVSEILKGLGFSLDYQGTAYLKEMLVVSIQRGTGYSLLRKDLYLIVQNKYNTTYEKVRQKVRYAISTAFSRPTILAKMIFSDVLETKKHPTIKGFITGTYDYISQFNPPVE